MHLQSISPLGKMACPPGLAAVTALTDASPALHLARTMRGGSGGVSLGVITGLLASNCCVIQLALNTVGFGCAGLRRLERYRPYFLLLHVLALAMVWARRSAAVTAACGCQGPATVGAGRAIGNRLALSALLLALAFSENGVRFVNDRGGIRHVWQSIFRAKQRISAAAGAGAAVGGETAARTTAAVPMVQVQHAPLSEVLAPEPAPLAAECSASASDASDLKIDAVPAVAVSGNLVRLEVSGMKCEACRNGVIRALNALPFVSFVEVQLSSSVGGQRSGPGVAVVKLTGEAPAAARVHLLDAVSMAGYSATLDAAQE